MVQNSEKTLAIALESLDRIYDELIIVDGGSTDKTCEIAARYGAKIVYSPWSGDYAQQRNIYLREVKTEWVFVLDSDEFIDLQVVGFLRSIKNHNQFPNYDLFEFNRRWISPNRCDLYIVSPPHALDYHPRLFRYRSNFYYTRAIHEVINGYARQELGSVRNAYIYHLDLFVNSEAQRIKKVERYSKAEANSGGAEYYLPDSDTLKLREWDIQSISPSAVKLLNQLTPMSKSLLDSLIPPEIKNDDFYELIQRIAQSEDIKTVLEIGSSSGEGSTEALVKGLRKNPNQPTLFCMELSKTRFARLQKTYSSDSFVKCYNVSSVELNQFPEEAQVIDFYNNYQTGLNQYPLEQVLGWLRQDIEYVRSSGVPKNGIDLIKSENSLDSFDLVLIDGSEFTGYVELDRVYGAKYIFLDDINSYKNHCNFNRLYEDNNYTLLRSNFSLRNGYALFKSSEIQPQSYQTIQYAVESIEGFMLPGQEEYLFDRIKTLPDNAVVVEIGSYKGRSTVAMAYACIGTKRKIYCIDTWDGNDKDFPDRDFFEIWNENLKNNRIEQYVVPLQGYSYEILKCWQDLTEGTAIDFIFIDGSHQYLDVLQDFQLSYPWIKSEGWMAFHDVVPTWPGSEQVWHNIAKDYLSNHEYVSTLACGQKIKKLAVTDLQLPIHFFTIVLNGEPFIRYHIDVFKQLPFKWHWHIVEGVADLKHDTSWSFFLGGSVTDEIHNQGCSKDGTSEYLDELAQQYPENVTIYRKPAGEFWDGKREMVNAPLESIQEECLLWQLDVDELWTVEQICTGRHLFIAHPGKTAAFYWCWYFVGEDLVISTRNCYTQNPQQEWLRTWRFKPGYFWAAHEPPVLVETLPDGQLRNIAAVDPLTHAETEEKGLIFQHFAYIMPEQLQFKEQYYGYNNALQQWQTLKQEKRFPVLLREYFGWVGDDTLVDRAESQGIIPIVQKDTEENWQFVEPEPQSQRRITPRSLAKPIVAVDGVFFQYYSTGIARVWRSLLQEWVESGFAKHVLVLDRGGSAPKIPGIRYLTIPAHDYSNMEADRVILQEICDKENVNLFISTYYSFPTDTPSVFVAHDMIPELVGANLQEPMWREKREALQRASAYIAVSENTARDLKRFCPKIKSVTVACNGVDPLFSPTTSEEVQRFKAKYGISKPYFLLVAPYSGYKNASLFFQAFAQLSTRLGFELVSTGNRGWFDEEWRNYTVGNVVHTLQLSDEELRLAYAGAIALVYPSKYEGFGLPVLEALACACPVITTPNASLPEVAGDAALYVKDDDVEEMANALCEIQKPAVRQSLISKGLEQAKKFSWTKMAEIVSSALIETMLLPLNLREMNFIIFPDWMQAEEELGLELQQVIQEIATHPESDRITLLIDTTGIPEEDANLLLSGVVMNLLMEEDIDVSEGAEISLLGELAPTQWDALRSRLQARIVLEQENEQAIAQAGLDSLPTYNLNDNA